MAQKKWYPFSQRETKQLRAKTDESEHDFVDFPSGAKSPPFPQKSLESEKSVTCTSCIMNENKVKKNELSSNIWEVTCYPSFKKKEEPVIYYDLDESKKSSKSFLH